MTFGYVGTVQNRRELQKSARVIFTCLRTMALTDFVLREVVAPGILIDRCLDCLTQFYLLGIRTFDPYQTKL